MTEPISAVPAITTTPDVAAVVAEQTAIDGSGSEKYGASDWTAATGAGLDYPGGASFDPTPSSPAPAAGAPHYTPAVTTLPKPAVKRPTKLDPPARTPYN